MSKCKLETCLNPVTGRQIYCTDRCRQRARKTIPIRCHPLSRNLRITTEYHVEGEEAPPAIRARRRGLRVLATPCDGPCRTSSSVTPLHSCPARSGYQSELWKMVNERSTPYPKREKLGPRAELSNATVPPRFRAKLTSQRKGQAWQDRGDKVALTFKPTPRCRESTGSVNQWSDGFPSPS